MKEKMSLEELKQNIKNSKCEVTKQQIQEFTSAIVDGDIKPYDIKLSPYPIEEKWPFKKNSLATEPSFLVVKSYHDLYVSYFVRWSYDEYLYLMKILGFATFDEAKKYLENKDYLNFSETQTNTEHLKILYSFFSLLEYKKIHHKNALANSYFQKITNEVIIPNLTKWLEDNKNLPKEKVKKVYKEFWQFLGTERGDIAQTVNANKKEKFGSLLEETFYIKDSMINVSNSGWKGWFEYIAHKFIKEINQPISKHVNKNPFVNKNIKNLFLENFFKPIKEELLSTDTHYAILHHEKDFTDANFKQEHNSAFYIAYTKDENSNIKVTAVVCKHLEYNKNRQAELLAGILDAKDVKEVYEWYYHANQESIYKRGASAIFNWIASAKAKLLGGIFNETKDIHKASVKIPFEGQLDQLALSCFSKEEFTTALESLNPDIFKQDYSYNDQQDYNVSGVVFDNNSDY